MKTVVYQSFRTKDVPPWISLCLNSVREWAFSQGFEYRFYDDAFFEFVPSPWREKASAHKCVLADYARLVAARELLQEGWDRAIWIDADALIFAPEKLTIPIATGYAFSREIWLDRIAFQRPHFRLQVNNAAAVFCRDQKIIDFYLAAAQTKLSAADPIAPTSIGTDFLTGLRRAIPFPLLTQIGIFGPEMAKRYLKQDGSFLAPYLAYQTSPVYAVNLCLSHQTTENSPDPLRVIEHLKADQGESLNRWFMPSYEKNLREFDRPLARYIAARQSLRSFFRAMRGT